MVEKVLGLIPARGGSKGVPLKNIREVNGKPLIAYTISIALESSLIDRVIVSTDNEEIARVSRSYGADVPFLRPAELATDVIPDGPVLSHAIRWLQENANESYSSVAYLRPTTPLKTSAIIDKVIAHLRENSHLDSVRTVTRATGIHHPYWMYKLDGNKGTLQSFIPGVKFAEYYQRQLLPECFRINGLVDAMRVTAIDSSPNCWGESIGIIEVDPSLELDIDTELDLQHFSFLMQFQTGDRL